MIKPGETLTLDFLEDVLVLFWCLKGTRILLIAAQCAHRSSQGSAQEMLHLSLGWAISRAELGDMGTQRC